MSAILKPVYRTPQANTPIPLGHSDIEITSGNEKFRGRGEANLLLQPRMQLIVTADLFSHGSGAMRLGIETKPLLLRYGLNSKPVKALVWGLKFSTSTSAPAQSVMQLFPNPQRLTICADRRKRLGSVIFHVMNFPDFISTGPESTDRVNTGQSGMRRLSCAEFSNHEWRVEVQALPETKELVEELRTTGGSAITHVGRLRHRDGRSFTVSAAERCLEDLRIFLSFARGLWTPTVLPVGCDLRGNRIFEEWGVPIETPAQACVSWFDRNHGEALEKLFSGFISLLHDPVMGQPIRVALYWYLMSNRGGEGTGIDSGIILSQAALERLASAYLAKARLSSGRRAADRLRRAAKDLKLPVAIPKAAPSVYRHREKGAWKDIPDAITTVRNELVHPKTRIGVDTGRVLADSWYLAQWYIELFVLRLSAYDYTYSNRLRARWHGQVETVPWSR